MNLTWIWHEWKYNVTRLNMHEFSMNPAWIQHEFNTMLQPKYILKLSKKSRFSAAFWIGGLDLESKNLLWNLFFENAWIQHESSMNGFFIFLTPPTPNHQSKPPLKQIWCNVQINFGQIFIQSNSCRFHAGFTPDSCIYIPMPNSCQIHAGFSWIQFCHSFTLTYVVFMPVSCRFHAFIYLCRIHVRFMPDSVEFSFAIHLHWPTLFSCRFHAGFMHLYTYAEFMSDSCRIQLNSALPFIHVDLCRFHAGFMLFSIIVTSTCIHIKPDSIKFNISLHKHRMIIM